MRRIRPDANFVAEQARRMTELLQPRGNLSVEDREYAAEKLEKLKESGGGGARKAALHRATVGDGRYHPD